MTSEYRDTPTIVQNPAVSRGVKAVVNAQTEYPAEIVRLLDYYFTEEGKMAGAYGYEGIDWDLEPLGVVGLEEYQVAAQREVEGYSSAEE